MSLADFLDDKLKRRVGAGGGRYRPPGTSDNPDLPGGEALPTGPRDRSGGGYDERGYPIRRPDFDDDEPSGAADLASNWRGGGGGGGGGGFGGRDDDREENPRRADEANNWRGGGGGGGFGRGDRDRGGDRYDDRRGGGGGGFGRDRYDDRRGGDRYDDRRGGGGFGRDRFDDRRGGGGGDRYDDRDRDRGETSNWRRGGPSAGGASRMEDRSPPQRRRLNLKPRAKPVDAPAAAAAAPAPAAAAAAPAKSNKPNPFGEARPTTTKDVRELTAEKSAPSTGESKTEDKWANAFKAKRRPVGRPSPTRANDRFAALAATDRDSPAAGDRDAAARRDDRFAKLAATDRDSPAAADRDAAPRPDDRFAKLAATDRDVPRDDADAAPAPVDRANNRFARLAATDTRERDFDRPRDPAAFASFSSPSRDRRDNDDGDDARGPPRSGGNAGGTRDFGVRPARDDRDDRDDGGRFGGRRDRDRDNRDDYGRRDRDDGGRFGGRRDRDRDRDDYGRRDRDDGGRFGGRRDRDRDDYGSRRDRDDRDGAGGYSARRGVGGGDDRDSYRSRRARAEATAPRRPREAEGAPARRMDDELYANTMKHNIKRLLKVYINDTSLRAEDEAMEALKALNDRDIYPLAVTLMVQRAAQDCTKAELVMLSDLAFRVRAAKPALLTPAEYVDALVTALNSSVAANNMANVHQVLKAVLENAALPKALIPNELAAVASPGDGADSGAADSESKAVSVEDLVAEVVASTLRGDELAAFAKDKLAGREDDVAQPLMRALMMAQHEAGTLNSAGACFNPDQLAPMLSGLLYEHQARSVAALRGLNQAVNAVGFPKGLVEATFMHLYDKDIIQEEAFTAWKDDYEDQTEGRGTAIIQLTRWFMWLAEDDDDSDEDEEDSDDE